MKVSVVLAVYNEERFIGEALESILSQRGVDVEVIVVDDQSTDKTPTILANFAEKYSNLRIVRNEQKGKVSAFNLGVEISTGDWVAIFAGDDIMPSDSLRQRLECALSSVNPGPAIALSRLSIVSDNPKWDGVEVPKMKSRGAYSGVCYLMNRAALEVLWPIPDSLPNEDTWLELGARHLPLQVIHVPIVGCWWRMHENNSINLDLEWDDFNDRYSKRRAAILLFEQTYKQLLSVESLEKLERKIRCETSRVNGSVLGILRSQAPASEVLRAIAYSSPFYYGLRRRAKALLSGLF